VTTTGVARFTKNNVDKRPNNSYALKAERVK